jgi:hypothetical protein
LTSEELELEAEERQRFEENKLKKALEEEEKTIGEEEVEQSQIEPQEQILTTAWNIWSNLVDNVKKTVKIHSFFQ